MSGLHAVAEFDYQAQEPTELSVQAGQPLIVVDKSDPQWWYLRTTDGITGYVPADFICLKVGDKLVKRAIVKFEYASESPTELSLVLGATIMVLDDNPDEEWWEGEYLGKTGFFPRDFIEIVPRGDGPQSVPASPASGGAKPVVKRARVQFDYAAEGENEIDLAEGDELVLIDDDPNEEWWEGKLSNGKVGFFPKSFVTLITSTTTATTGTGAVSPRSVVDASSTSTAATTTATGNDTTETHAAAAAAAAAAAPAPAAALPTFPRRKAKATFEFQAETDTELSLKEGDIVELIDAPDDEEWWEGATNGRTGFFPRDFVQILGSNDSSTSTPTATTTTAAQPAIVAAAVSSSNSSNSLTAPPAAATTATANVTPPITSLAASPSGVRKADASKPRKTKVLYDYAAEGPSEISLKTGETIILYDDDPNEEWWEGEIEGRPAERGFFPATYVEKAGASSSETKKKKKDKGEGKTKKGTSRSASKKMKRTKTPTDLMANVVDASAAGASSSSSSSSSSTATSTKKPSRTRELENRVKALEMELAQLQGVVAQKDAELATHVQQHTELSEELAVARQKAATADKTHEETRSLTIQLNELKRKVGSADSDRVQLTTQLGQLQSKVQSLQETATQRDKQLADAHASVERERKKADQLQGEVVRLTSQLQQRDAEVAQLRADLDTANDAAGPDVEQLKNEVETLQADLEKASEEKQALKQELEKLRSSPLPPRSALPAPPATSTATTTTAAPAIDHTRPRGASAVGQPEKRPRGDSSGAASRPQKIAPATPPPLVATASPVAGAESRESISPVRSLPARPKAGHRLSRAFVGTPVFPPSSGSDGDTNSQSRVPVAASQNPVPPARPQPKLPAAPPKAGVNLRPIGAAPTAKQPAIPPAAAAGANTPGEGGAPRPVAPKRPLPSAQPDPSHPNGNNSLPPHPGGSGAPKGTGKLPIPGGVAGGPPKAGLPPHPGGGPSASNNPAVPRPMPAPGKGMVGPGPAKAGGTAKIGGAAPPGAGGPPKNPINRAPSASFSGGGPPRVPIPSTPSGASTMDNLGGFGDRKKLFEAKLAGHENK